MALEPTVNYISDLDPTSPAGTDPKSQGDNHLQNIKKAVKQTFPNVTGAVTVDQAALNSVTTRATKTGDTYTGTHDFTGATVNVPNATTSNNAVNLQTAQALLSGGGTPSNIPVTGLGKGSLSALQHLRLNSAGTALEGDYVNAKGATIASAATVNLDTASGDFVHISGTTTITAITLASGTERTVVFDGALTLTNGANLILPTGANITTAAGDSMKVRGDGAGVARVVSYQKANGQALSYVPAALVLVATLTPTAAANVDALNAFSSTYDNYLIVGDGLTFASGTTDFLAARFAVGGAADTAANYFNIPSNNSQTTATAQFSLSSSVSQPNTVSFELVVLNANATGASSVKGGQVRGIAYNVTTPVAASTNIGLVYLNTGAVSGIRFFWNGGSTFSATGKIRIYGISNS